MAEKQKLKPGIYPNVPFDEYLQWEAINNTLLRIIDTQSAAHAKTHKDNPPPPSKAFEQGRIFHALTLEPMDFDSRYAVAPQVDRRTKAGKEAWGAFEASVDGKHIVVEEDYQACLKMAEAVQAHRAAWNLLRFGQPEVCIIWQDPLTGLLCKARLDYVHLENRVIVDLKSTRDASPDAFSKAIWNYGYHQQAAFYLDGLGTLLGDVVEFVFVPVEKTEPFAAACYRAASDILTMGVEAYQRSLQTYKECVVSGEWPAYSQEVELITLPRWAQSAEMLAERYEL
jgi:hypothetical protein